MEWSQIAGYGITGGVALLLGLVGYRAVPPKDRGNVANSTVDAAGKAIGMLQDSYQRKVDDLEARVTRLEALVLEKEQQVERLDKERALLLRWIAVLSEQVTKAGQVPVTIEELRHLDKLGGRPDV